MQTTQLALFPLQLFLLPGETTQLHIFEERYRQLLADCEVVQHSFGIPFTENGTVTGYGSMVNVKQVLARHEDGSADIEIEAVGIFKVQRFFMRLGEKLYPGGDVVIIEQDTKTPMNDALFSIFNEYVAESDRMLAPDSFSAHLDLIDLARILQMEDTQKIKFLKAKTLADKQQFLMDELKMRLLLLKQKNSVEHNIFLN